MKKRMIMVGFPPESRMIYICKKCLCVCNGFFFLLGYYKIKYVAKSSLLKCMYEIVFNIYCISIYYFVHKKKNCSTGWVEKWEFRGVFFLYNT